MAEVLEKNKTLIEVKISFLLFPIDFISLCFLCDLLTKYSRAPLYCHLVPKGIPGESGSNLTL